MKLYSEKYSSLAKSDLLFLHGNLASTAWWGPTLQEWKQAGSLGDSQLIMADWRGCGQNPEWPKDKTFSIEDLARDFLELLNDQGIERIGLVGHSLGGLIALQMMILEPKRFTKALLLDPVGAEGVVFDESMYEAFRQMALNFDLTRTVILSTVHNAAKQPEQLTELIAKDAFKAVQGIGSSVLEILKTTDLREEARLVNIPVMVLHGRHDQVIPLHDSEKLVQLLPNAQLEVLEAAGHCWNVENPADFTRRVRQWFQ